MRAQGLRISDNFPIQTTKFWFWYMSNRCDIKLMSYRHDDWTGFALEDQSVMKLTVHDFPTSIRCAYIYEPHVWLPGWLPEYLTSRLSQVWDIQFFLIRKAKKGTCLIHWWLSKLFCNTVWFKTTSCTLLHGGEVTNMKEFTVGHLWSTLPARACDQHETPTVVSITERRLDD